MKLKVIEDSARVRLELESRPESVTLVRSALAAFAEVLAIDGELLDDLKTAVSEACNNVVIHAYDGQPGPLTVSIESTPRALEVVVADQGDGIQQLSASEDRMGVGLAVISALADRAEFQSPHGGGTAVRMGFDRGGSGVRMVYGTPIPPGNGAPPLALAGDVVVWLAPSELLAPVLGRIARAMAATSHFSLERFADLYPVSDALAAYSERAATGGPVGFSVRASTRRLELTTGPFLEPDGPLAADARERLAALEQLVDELAVEPVGDVAQLQIAFADHSRARPPRS